METKIYHGVLAKHVSVVSPHVFSFINAEYRAKRAATRTAEIYEDCRYLGPHLRPDERATETRKKNATQPLPLKS